MVAIQFQFVYEMGEVYTKITSENPKDSSYNMKILRIKFIVLYSLEALALTLNLLMNLNDWDITSYFKDAQ